MEITNKILKREPKCPFFQNEDHSSRRVLEFAFVESGIDVHDFKFMSENHLFDFRKIENTHDVFVSDFLGVDLVDIIHFHHSGGVRPDQTEASVSLDRSILRFDLSHRRDRFSFDCSKRFRIPDFQNRKTGRFQILFHEVESGVDFFVRQKIVKRTEQTDDAVEKDPGLIGLHGRHVEFTMGISFFRDVDHSGGRIDSLRSITEGLEIANVFSRAAAHIKDGHDPMFSENTI